MEWEIFPEYDIIWTDPPWEQKMVNFFETMMFKTGQPKPMNSSDGIIKQLAMLAHLNRPVFIEYSLNGSETVIEIMVKAGHLFCNKVLSTQENGKPYCILVFNSIDFEPDGQKQGFKIIDFTCEHLNFNTVFDPFAGIGKTAKSFIKHGKTYIGSEINTARFDKLKNIIWPEQ